MYTDNLERWSALKEIGNRLLISIWFIYLGLLAVGLTSCALSSSPPISLSAEAGTSPSEAGTALSAGGETPDDSMSGGQPVIEDPIEPRPMGGETPPPIDLADVELSPAPSTLHRLSARQLYTTFYDIFGVEVETALEEDTSLHGFVSVAGSELTISPRLAEQIEEASWVVARAVVSTPEHMSALFPCEVFSDSRCMTLAFYTLARRAWRRPITQRELDKMTALSQEVGALLRDPLRGIEAVIAMMIQSPHLVFRVELGEPDPTLEPSVLNPAPRRYTSLEMASRLSYFFWGAPPDDQLLDAGESGGLVDDMPLRVQAERLLNHPRARTHLLDFFDEMIGLQNLDSVQKDPILFPEVTPALRASMRAEIHALFDDIVFERDEDFRTLLTSERALIDAHLADIYSIPFSGERAEMLSLPEGQERGGLLGRAGILTLFSHATVNSPTYRGRFVRATLLCQDVPPPPEGVITELPEPEADVEQTLRQRLSAHVTDPTCAGCHSLMDPLGFPLERFNPIGRWRTSDAGQPIDATGSLDGVSIDGARSLGAAVAASPLFSGCVTRRLYRYGTGQLEGFGELDLLEAMAEDFRSALEHRFIELALSVALSPGFRRASPPRGEYCETSEANEERPCSTLCGIGVERCENGYWSACDAPLIHRERCDGVDQDCDGLIDEGLTQGCQDLCDSSGVQRCESGSWGACEGPSPTPERCDGIDQDCDGVIDEEITDTERCDGVDQDCDGVIDEEITDTERCDGIDQDCDGVIDEGIDFTVEDLSYETLSMYHEGCSLWGQRIGDQCNSASHRYCGQAACGVTGFGPLESGPESGLTMCIGADDARLLSITYSVLSLEHSVCDGIRERIGPNCNAAIHRYCASQALRTGYGPVEHNGEHVSIVCTPNASVIASTYTALHQRHSSCSQEGERIGANCNAAIHRECVGRGFLSGWGPIENIGDTAMISCIGGGDSP